MTDIDNGLAEVLSLALGRPVAPGEKLARETTDKWNSLADVEILLGIEETFEIQLDPEALAKVTTTDELRALVAGLVKA